MNESRIRTIGLSIIVGCAVVLGAGMSILVYTYEPMPLRRSIAPTVYSVPNKVDAYGMSDAERMEHLENFVQEWDNVK